MTRFPARFAIIVASSMLALAACGGDDSSSDADLQQQVAELEAQIAELNDSSNSADSSIATGSPATGGTPSSSDGGVTSLDQVPAPLAVSDNGLYDDQAQAEQAAEAIGCEGSHQMGDQYMPCGEHGELDEIEAEADQAPPAEPAPVADETEYEAPAEAAAEEAPAEAALEPIGYDIQQGRRNASTFDVTIEAEAPGLPDQPFGIRSVCIYQYNEYGSSINGDPKTPCSGGGRKVAVYLEYAQIWKVSGSCGLNGSIKDYYDIGIVAHDGRSVVVRVNDSPC